jgi:membrane-associated phospholipid phosphatase
MDFKLRFFYGIIFSLVSNILLKNTCTSIFGKKCSRPNNINSSGMPSGHAQLSSFIAMFLILYLIKYSGVLIPLLILFAVYTGYSRIIKKRHDIPQVIIGSIIGILSGYSIFYL